MSVRALKSGGLSRMTRLVLLAMRSRASRTGVSRRAVIELPSQATSLPGWAMAPVRVEPDITRR